MPEEGNGDNGSSRLDRLERAVEALVTAQILTTENVDKLTKNVNRIAEKVESHEDRIQALIDSQLRMDQNLSKIQMLLDRQQGQ